MSCCPFKAKSIVVYSQLLQKFFFFYAELKRSLFEISGKIPLYLLVRISKQGAELRH